MRTDHARTSSRTEKLTMIAMLTLVAQGMMPRGYVGKGHARGYSKGGHVTKATARRRMRKKMAHKSRVYNSMQARGKR